MRHKPCLAPQLFFPSPPLPSTVRSGHLSVKLAQASAWSSKQTRHHQPSHWPQYRHPILHFSCRPVSSIYSASPGHVRARLAVFPPITNPFPPNDPPARDDLGGPALSRMHPVLTCLALKDNR